MKCRLFNLLALLSLLLCVGSFVLWIVSCTATSRTLPEFLKDGKRWELSGGYLYVRATSDSEHAAARAKMIEFQRLSRRATAQDVGHWSTSAGGGDEWIFFGRSQEIETWTMGGVTGAQEVLTGYWISPWLGVVTGLAGVSLILGCRKLQTIGVARRQRNSLCRMCGYDLRASPERCPECGTASATPTASTTHAALGAGE